MKIKSIAIGWGQGSSFYEVENTYMDVGKIIEGETEVGNITDENNNIIGRKMASTYLIFGELPEGSEATNGKLLSTVMKKDVTEVKYF